MNILRGLAQCLSLPFLVIPVILAISSCSQLVVNVEIFVDVPSGLSSYTGVAPVTFGIPFQEGELASSDKMKIVDGNGDQVAAQFQVTSTWPGSGDVRWILVDMLVDISSGSVGQYYFHALKGPAQLTTFQPMDVQESTTEISIAPSDVPVSNGAGASASSIMTVRRTVPVGPDTSGDAADVSLALPGDRAFMDSGRNRTTAANGSSDGG